MSSETSSKIGSSCSDSVSFPNTRIQSTKPFEMGSKVFRFKPVRSDVLIKQLLEEEEDSPKAEKNPLRKTSQILQHRGRNAKNDSFSSDDDADQNILDKTLTEDDSFFNSKDLVPGVSWLDSPPDRKPLKIITKPVPSTPMTNMFNKLSIRNESSARKEPRSVSVDRKDDHVLLQTPANSNNDMFKTPSCKNSRIIPSSSTSQKLQFVERSAIPSINNQLFSAKKKQEIVTPRQKIVNQPNKNLETPRHNSILQAAIRRNYNTPVSILPSGTKEGKIISDSAKKSEAVLREKNMNVGLIRQRSREYGAFEERNPLSKPNKLLSYNSELKQLSINEEKHLPTKQLNSSEDRNKQTNNSEFKQLCLNEERLSNKQSNISEEKPVLNKQLSINEERLLSHKYSNSSEFKQLSINEERLPNKQSNISEEKPVLNKHLNGNEFKQLSTNEERLLSNKQSNSHDFKQMNINEERQLINKQPNNSEVKQMRINEERQLLNKQTSSSGLKQCHIKEERQFANKQSSSNELKQLSNNEPNKQSNSGELKQSHINEAKQLQNKQSNSNELKQPIVQISIPTKPLQESTFQQLKVKGKEYIVINKIGEGGSGQVYRCLEQETLTDRAIKVVNLNVDPATRTSYRNEVNMLKELQGNDRVIRMYDSEQVNHNLFVVMEKGDVDFSIFLRNITAETQIQTHVIVCYWIEMLKCVREIHNKGIIHSDLKPSNFLIVGGRLKLIDFGIASRLNAEMTSVIKNVPVGTFNYISPEALQDSRDCPADDKPQLRISYKSDVWSLGCILYQMVYKKTPFQFVGNMWAKLAVITDRNHKIEYPQIPGVPLFLIEMIKKCLVYDMRSRPTVEELLNMYYNGNYC